MSSLSLHTVIQNVHEMHKQLNHEVHPCNITDPSSMSLVSRSPDSGLLSVVVVFRSLIPGLWY